MMTKKETNKKSFWLFLRVVISVALVCLMIYMVRGQISRLVTRDNLLFIGIAAIIFAFETVVLAIRWRILNSIFMNAPGMAPDDQAPQNFPLSWYLRTSYESLALSQCLPSSFGGDAWRIFQTRSLYESILKTSFSVLFDRMTGLIVLGLLMLVSVGFVWQSLPEMTHQFFFWILVLGVLASIFGLVFWVFRNKIFAMRLFQSPLGTKAQNFLSIVAFTRLSSWAVITALAALLHLMTVLALLALSSGMGISLTLPAAMFVVAFGLIFAIVPITFGGWGIREGAMVAALSFFNVLYDDAIILSLSFGLSILISTMPGAFMFMINNRASNSAKSVSEA